MLRAGELAKIVDKAEIALALSDSRIATNWSHARRPAGFSASRELDGTSTTMPSLSRRAEQTGSFRSGQNRPG